MASKYLIQDLEGALSSHISTFHSFGIKTLDQLLEKTPYPLDRKFLAEKTGLPVEDIYYYANMSDLMRVKGIGKEFSELLAHSGIRNMQSLAVQNADELFTKTTQINDENKYAGRNPKAEEITNWISQAKDLGIRLHDVDPAGYVSTFAKSAGAVAAAGTTSACTTSTCSTTACNAKANTCKTEDSNCCFCWKWLIGLLALLAGLWHILKHMTCFPIIKWIIIGLTILLAWKLIAYFFAKNNDKKTSIANTTAWLALAMLLSCLACLFMGKMGGKKHKAPAIKQSVEANQQVKAKNDDLSPAISAAWKEVEAEHQIQTGLLNQFTAGKDIDQTKVKALQTQGVSMLDKIKNTAFSKFKSLNTGALGALPQLKTGFIDEMKNIGGRYLSRLKGLEAFYTDVPETNQYYKAVAYMKENNMMPGFANNTFRLNALLTRSDLVDLLLSMKKVDTSKLKNNNCYPDVSTKFNASGVCYASAQGWVSGYEDGTFKPDQTVTRAEALKMIMNIVSDEEPKAAASNPYSDVSADAWYAKYVLAAKEANLLGNASVFRPEDMMTRGDIAQIVYNTKQ